MNDIANLQEAVETARAAYTRASEQHARSRKHAMSLIHIVEEQLRDKRIELSQNDVKRERMTREYGQLRQMLHTLVMTVEVDATGTARYVSTLIETQPNGVLAPAVPVAVTSEEKEPVATAAPSPKRRRKRATAEAVKSSAGAEALRAGLKRMLKKKQPPPVVGLEAIKGGETGAPAAAE